jgi:hypothetical protein
MGMKEQGGKQGGKYSKAHPGWWNGEGGGDDCGGEITFNRLICKLLQETKMEIRVSVTFLPETSFGSELH